MRSERTKMMKKRGGTRRVEEEEKEELVVWKLGDELIAFDILSRLPIKYLMRFKCVSKHWKSFIHEDQLFIDYLHTSLLNQRTSLLLVGKPRYTSQPRCLFTVELLQTSDEHDGNEIFVGSTTQWIAPHFVSEYRVCTLEGLICFMDIDNYRASVYNCTTREETAWIKSVIKQEADEEQGLYRYSNLILLNHEFGYDPVTKEYKVVALWRLCRRNRETGAKTVDVVCEALTVRKNSWRKIDVNLRSSLLPDKIVSSVYKSGSIYWHCERDKVVCSTATEIQSYFVKFNVHDEKFRFVGTSRHLYDGFYMSNLIELDGQLARLLGEKIQVGESDNIYNTKLCLLREPEIIDEDIKDRGFSSWDYLIEEIIPMTTFKWKSIPSTWRSDQKDLTIRHVPGTADLFLIRSLEDEDFSLYFYDRKKKSLGSNKIKINGLSSELKGENGESFYYDDFEFYTFTPNLSPVN